MKIRWRSARKDPDAHKILVIDDEQMVLNVMKEILDLAGYHVAVADNGEYGLRCVRHKSPDLVIIDVAMPGMNGYEVMEKIREIRYIPIVMISGHAQLDDVLSRNDPPDAFIRKPFSRKLLLSTVEYLLVPSYGL